MTYDALRLTYGNGDIDTTSSNLTYLIRNIQGVDPTQEKSAFSLSPPGLPPEDNILLGTQGQTREYRVQFKPFDNGDDTAEGSHSSTVVTLEEQYTYLRDVIHDEDPLAEYQLDDVHGGYIPTDEPVYLERFNGPFYQVDSPKFPEWTMTIRVGGGV